MKPKRKTYYSGELSRAFWKEVNAMAIEDNDILYSIAKHLQDLEDIVLKEMYRRQNKPKSPPMDAKELLRDNNITCTRCHGTGNVWLLKDDEEECPECDGTGCGAPDSWSEAVKLMESYANHKLQELRAKVAAIEVFGLDHQALKIKVRNLIDEQLKP